MSRRRATPRPEYALSPEALRQQLIRANDRTALLEARNTALRSQLRQDPDPLLVELAQAIHLAREISNPQQAHNYDPSGIRHSTEPPTPGASTANQRRASKHFYSQLEKALQEFEGARQRNWQSRDKVPRVRCVNRECADKDKRQPAWDYRGANEYCRSCGHRLTKMTADIT